MELRIICSECDNELTAELKVDHRGGELLPYAHLSVEPCQNCIDKAVEET